MIRLASTREACVTIRSGFWGDPEPSSARPVPVRVVRNGDISWDGRIRSYADRFFSVREADLSRVESGDVLMTSSGDIGKIAIDAERGLHVSNFVRMLRPRPEFDGQFIARALQGPASRRAMAASTGTSTIPNLLGAFFDIPLVPAAPLDDQRRIAGRISGQVAIVQGIGELVWSLRDTAAQTAKSVVTLATSRAYDRWPLQSLREVVRVVGSRSTVSNGDTEVLTVTSGCLTPAGFAMQGLRPNRMRREDVDHATLALGEILIARSNTEDLVGRTARYPGEPSGVVATDLVFRLIVDDSKADGPYISAILAGLQLQGYWKQRSSGASSTMKKITKVQLGDVIIPLPPLVQQREISASLDRQLQVVGRALQSLEAEVEAARALSTAILIREFGALSSADS